MNEVNGYLVLIVNEHCHGLFLRFDSDTVHNCIQLLTAKTRQAPVTDVDDEPISLADAANVDAAHPTARYVQKEWARRSGQKYQFQQRADTVTKLSLIDPVTGCSYAFHVSECKATENDITEFFLQIEYEIADTRMFIPEILYLLESIGIVIAVETLINIRRRLMLHTKEVILNEVILQVKQMQGDDIFCEQFARIHQVLVHWRLLTIQNLVALSCEIADLLFKHNFPQCAKMILQSIRHSTEAKQRLASYEVPLASAVLFSGRQATETREQRLNRIAANLPALLTKHGDSGIQLGLTLLAELAGCGLEPLIDEQGEIDLSRYAEPEIFIRVLRLLQKARGTVYLEATVEPKPPVLTSYTDFTKKDPGTVAEPSTTPRPVP